jgi:SAM-dependent methyltransferase
MSEEIKQAVQGHYAKVAQKSMSCCGGSTKGKDQYGQNLGYDKTDLTIVPESNLGVSCGNPQALADLQPGQTVLDLGSGAGFDMFIAADKVGPTGKAIGVDMTPDMIQRARDLAEKHNIPNVEFKLGEIENLPIASNSVDVVISNCVINLVPNKAKAWQEIARVLKPGGKVAVSDIALLKKLPWFIRNRMEAHAGCIAGAESIDDYVGHMKAAGLDNVRVEAKTGAIDMMVDAYCKTTRLANRFLPKRFRLSAYIASVNVTGFMPVTEESPAVSPEKIELVEAQ